ncbi:hypothetical protein OBK29_03985 [Empedobacter falsenii]|uniref:hypothetical protein n=1 Tax=Empedobacter falsenii TaxID=343874 RepID=UPI003A7FB992
MSELQISRSKGRKPTRCILHKVADIPGGVAIDPASLEDERLLEGAPLAKGKGGLYEVVGNAFISKAADTSATSIDVLKGSHLKVGMTILGAKITAIDKSKTDFDTLTLDKGFSKAVAKGDVIGESKVVIAVCGEEKNVSDKGNVFVSAWVIAVIQESNCPGLTTEQKATAPTLVYV